MSGLTFKTTSRNIRVARLHYSAHPKRGLEWVAKNKPLMDEDKWNQEQEISYEVAAGAPVLKVKPAIHFRPLTFIDGKVLWRGWDFGFRNPACSVTQMNLKDQWCWLWGEVGENESLRDFAHRMFEQCDARFPSGLDARGRPQEQLWLDHCDPAGIQVSDKSDKGESSIMILEDAFKERYNRPMSLNWRRMSWEDGINIIRDKLKLRNDGEPGLLVNDDLDIAKDGLTGGYHYPEDRRSGAQCEYPEDDGYYIHYFDTNRYIAAFQWEADNTKAAMQFDDKAWPRPWEEEYAQHAVKGW